MSENNSYIQVQKVKEIPTLSGISIENLLSAFDSFDAFPLAASQTAIVRPAGYVKTSVLLSQVYLHSALQKSFNQNISALNGVVSLKNQMIAKIKAAAIRTLKTENLTIEDQAVVTNSIQKLMRTTTIKEATEELSSTFRTIGKQHAIVFTGAVSAAVRTAGIKTGFEQVRSEIVNPGLTRIVATNSKGINLISEIHTDRNHKVDIVSELEGITDGSCRQIMEQFNQNLADLGIIAERKDRKPTGGNCIMEYAKNLNRKRNTQKRVFSDEMVIKPKDEQKIYQFIN